MEAKERSSYESKQNNWREVIKAYEVTGQSAAAYCQAQDLNYSQFVYYRKKFSQKKRQAFIEVQARESTACKIHLSEGVRLDCQEWPSPQWLKALVRELG